MTFNDTGASDRSRGETSGNGGLSPEAGAGVPREPGLDARSLADLAAQDALELSRTPDAATMPLTADGGDGWSRTEASGPVPRPSTVAPGALEAVKDQGSSPEIQSPVTPRLFGQTMVRGAAMGQPETADDSKSGSGSGEEVLRTGTFTPDQGPTDVLPVSEDTGTGDRGTTNRLLGSDLTPRGATSPVPADRLTDSGGSDTTDRLLKVGVAVSRYGRDDGIRPGAQTISRGDGGSDQSHQAEVVHHPSAEAKRDETPPTAAGGAGAGHRDGGGRGGTDSSTPEGWEPDDKPEPLHGPVPDTKALDIQASDTGGSDGPSERNDGGTAEDESDDGLPLRMEHDEGRGLRSRGTLPDSPVRQRIADIINAAEDSPTAMAPEVALSQEVLVARDRQARAALLDSVPGVSVLDDRSQLGVDDFYYRCTEYTFVTRQGEALDSYQAQTLLDAPLDDAALSELGYRELESDEAPQEGDVIGYGYHRPVQTPEGGQFRLQQYGVEMMHYGVVEEDTGIVVSKFGEGPIVRHELAAVPSDYGDTVFFFRKEAEAVEEVEALPLGETDDAEMQARLQELRPTLDALYAGYHSLLSVQGTENPADLRRQYRDMGYSQHGNDMIVFRLPPTDDRPALAVKFVRFDEDAVHPETPEEVIIMNQANALLLSQGKAHLEQLFTYSLYDPPAIVSVFVPDRTLDMMSEDELAAISMADYVELLRAFQDMQPTMDIDYPSTNIAYGLEPGFTILDHTPKDEAYAQSLLEKVLYFARAVLWPPEATNPLSDEATTGPPPAVYTYLQACDVAFGQDFGNSLVDYWQNRYDFTIDPRGRNPS